MSITPPARRLVVIGRGVTAERVAALCGPLYEEITMSQEVVEVSAADHVVIAEDEPEAGRALLYMAVQAESLPAYLGYAAPHREGWKALVVGEEAYNVCDGLDPAKVIALLDDARADEIILVGDRLRLEGHAHADDLDAGLEMALERTSAGDTIISCVKTWR